MTSHPPPNHEDIKDRLHTLLLERCRLDPRTGCWPCDFAVKGAMPVMRVGGILYPALRVAAWVYRGEADGFELEDSEVTVRRALECPKKMCINYEHAVISRSTAAVMRKAA